MMKSTAFIVGVSDSGTVRFRFRYFNICIAKRVSRYHRYLRAVRVLNALWLDGCSSQWWKMLASDVRVGEPMLVGGDVAVVVLPAPRGCVAISGEGVIYPTESNISSLI